MMLVAEIKIISILKNDSVAGKLDDLHGIQTFGTEWESCVYIWTQNQTSDLLRFKLSKPTAFLSDLIFSTCFAFLTRFLCAFLLVLLLKEASRTVIAAESAFRKSKGSTPTQ